MDLDGAQGKDLFYRWMVSCESDIASDAILFVVVGAQKGTERRMQHCIKCLFLASVSVLKIRKVEGHIICADNKHEGINWMNNNDNAKIGTSRCTSHVYKIDTPRMNEGGERCMT